MTTLHPIPLAQRIDEIDSLRLQAQMLATRCIGLHQIESRDAMTREQRVEYDVLRGLFSDLRALVDRVEDGGW